MRLLPRVGVTKQYQLLEWWRAGERHDPDRQGSGGQPERIAQLGAKLPCSSKHMLQIKRQFHPSSEPLSWARCAVLA
jgi:hypothetical protein